MGYPPQGVALLTAHKATHEDGGSDELTLPLDPGTIAAHKTTHEDGGSDELTLPLDPRTGVAKIVRKTADETVNNSAVMQNDDHLFFSIGANEVWLVNLYLLCYSLSTTPDYKFGFAYPAGCTIRWGDETRWTPNPLSVDDLLAGTEILAANSMDNSIAGFPCGIHLVAIVINGATAGTINFQWAQENATVENSKILANSCLIAHRLA